jgi:hypothetical protein
MPPTISMSAMCGPWQTLMLHLRCRETYGSDGTDRISPPAGRPIIFGAIRIHFARSARKLGIESPTAMDRGCLIGSPGDRKGRAIVFAPLHHGKKIQ